MQRQRNQEATQRDDVAKVSTLGNTNVKNCEKIDHSRNRPWSQWGHISHWWGFVYARECRRTKSFCANCGAGVCRIVVFAAIRCRKLGRVYKAQKRECAWLWHSCLANVCVAVQVDYAVSDNLIPPISLNGHPRTFVSEQFLVSNWTDIPFTLRHMNYSRCKVESLDLTSVLQSIWLPILWRNLWKIKSVFP